MRTAPPPTKPIARRAAAQLSTQAPSAEILGKRGSLRGTDGQWLAEYTDWQSWARRYARQIGAASFSASVIADCCARCDIRVEERINGEWVETEDSQYADIMREYSNPLQMTDDLIRLHAWHYQVAGEMLLTNRDGDYGMEWGIYSTAAAEWERPAQGQVLIKLVPDGKVDKLTAFAVPREQVVRLWIPDQEWMAYAWSPMAASIDDLKRWRSLSRYVLRTADSALAMNGMLWAPGEAFETPPIETDEPEPTDVAEPKNVIEDQYWQTAKMRHSESDDVTAVAPFLIHWDKELGAPVWVKMGEGLDPEGIAHRKEALEDFARSSNLPVTTVIGGGVGDANHWSEWLASDKFFDSGVAPTMNRICHLDLTRTYLWPRARMAGKRDDQLIDIRIGYDPSPVIVKTDQSDIALQLNRAGLLANEATLEAANFSPADAMPPGPQRDWLLEVLSGQKPAGAPPGGGVGAPGKVGPGNIKQVMPPRPDVDFARAAHVNGGARQGSEREYERDDLGRFGFGSESGGVNELVGAGTKDDPIKGVASADEALRLIAEGKYVEMDPDLVAVSLDRMAEIAREAKEQGEKAPTYDLCNITSDDTSLFCGSSIVESRLEMPQLATATPVPGSPADGMERNEAGWVDITSAFTDSLAAQGIKSTNAEVDPATLKASQNDLDGAKVAGLMNVMAAGDVPSGSIMVSSDNYVIDGHHRWAAHVGTDYTGGGQLTMPVTRIDMPIQQVLDAANEFSKQMGVPQAGMGSISRSRLRPYSPRRCSLSPWSMMTVSAFTDDRYPILATAIDVAEEYGLDLVGGELLTRHGMRFAPDTLVTIVTARLASEREYERDERGRFGEGAGDGDEVQRGTVEMKDALADPQQFADKRVSANVKSRSGETAKVVVDVHAASRLGLAGQKVGMNGVGIRLVGIQRNEALGASDGDEVVRSVFGREPITIEGARQASEREYVRDDRGRFGEGDGGSADKNDTKFSTAADVKFGDWARQFPPGTVFRAGSPARIEAMKSGHDLGKPDPSGTAGESSDRERIGGIWVSDTAKAEYLDKGEIMAAFDPTGLPVVNEGAPGDLVLAHIPADRLIGTWTPGPDGARGYDVAPFHSRGRGMRGVEPEGVALVASARLGYSEDQPRDDLGRFGEGQGGPSEATPSSASEPPRKEDGTLDTAAFVEQNPQQEGENLFDYQGRLATMLDGSQDQSDLLFEIREKYEPVESVLEGAQQWNAEHNLDPIPDNILDQPADLAEADAVAAYFERTPDQSGTVEVEAAYDDFKRQNEEMYEFMTRSVEEGGLGIDVEFTTQSNPYPTAEAQAADLRDNNRIVIESGLGGSHGANMTTAEYDRFRAVHDTFGHAAIGGGFDRHGEYQAWLTHATMYTDPGRLAMSTEYHGVNSAMWATPETESPGTGKSVLLPEEFSIPPWERLTDDIGFSPAREGAVNNEPSTPPEIMELVEALGYDANFANHYKPWPWHYDEPQRSFAASARLGYSEDQPRDALGRFGEGSDTGEAPLIEAHAKTAELVTLDVLPPKVRDAVMGKITGPVPPLKPDEGWPKDANGKAIVPQPPEGQSWGLGTTPEEVRENYEEMFERGMANPEAREEGTEWYDRTHDEAARLGEEYGYSMEQTAGALAAMSAGTRWETEMPIMETMMKMDGTTLDFPVDRLEVVNAKLEKLGEDPVTNGMNIRDMTSGQAVQVMFNEHMTNGPGGWGAQYSFNQYERSLDFLRGDSTPVADLNGIKVREFYNNISNPGVEDHVTIDVMMMRIAAGDNSLFNDTRITSAPAYKTVGLGPTPYLADEVRRIADANDMTANDVQAVMWVQYLNEQKLAGRGGARGGA